MRKPSLSFPLSWALVETLTNTLASDTIQKAFKIWDKLCLPNFIQVGLCKPATYSGPQMLALAW